MEKRTESSTHLRWTELLQIILNEYIPKNKINKFSKLISEYGFNNLTYYNEEKQSKTNPLKIPIDILKQRLYNKISEVEEQTHLEAGLLLSAEPKVEEVDSDQSTDYVLWQLPKADSDRRSAALCADSSDQDTLLNKCDVFINKIKNTNKRNKHYYYYFGYYLQRFKNIYVIDHSIEDFNKFIEERYNMKKSKLYSYIQFFKLCQEYQILLTCDLTFTEIINNGINIKFLLNSS